VEANDAPHGQARYFWVQLPPTPALAQLPRPEFLCPVNSLFAVSMASAIFQYQSYAENYHTLVLPSEAMVLRLFCLRSAPQFSGMVGPMDVIL